MFERMKRQIPPRKLLIAFLTLGLILTGLESVHANNTRGGESARGWPTRRVGGGSRSGCSVAERPCAPLLALVPDGLLRTVSQSPTLLFYLPSIADPKAVRVELVLRDESDRLVYERTFSVARGESLLAVSLDPADNFRGLEAGRSYHWYLSVIRDPNDRSRDDLVEGWVQRVSPTESFSHRLAGANALERVKLYETEKLWPETLHELAELKRSRPGDSEISRLWKEAIASLQLPFSMGETIAESGNF
jgi:hypothetical protein